MCTFYIVSVYHERSSWIVVIVSGCSIEARQTVRWIGVGRVLLSQTRRPLRILYDLPQSTRHNNERFYGTTRAIC